MCAALRTIRNRHIPPRRDLPEAKATSVIYVDDRLARLPLRPARARPPADVRSDHDPRARDRDRREHDGVQRAERPVLAAAAVSGRRPPRDGLRLVHEGRSLGNAGTAIPDYLERREQAPSLESLAIWTGAARTLGGEGEPLRVLTTRASPSLFTVLRAAPQIGRVFTEDEATLGNDRVVVLSDRLWRTRFGASESVIGRDMRLDGDPFRVIGVMPPGFGYPNRNIDAWTPFAFTPQQTDRRRPRQPVLDQHRPTQARRDGGRAERRARGDRRAQLARAASRATSSRSRASPAARHSLREISVGNLEADGAVSPGQRARGAADRVRERREPCSSRALAAAGASSRCARRSARRDRLARLVLIESLVLAVVGALAGLLLASAASRSCARSASISRARASSSGSIRRCSVSRSARPCSRHSSRACRRWSCCCARI